MTITYNLSDRKPFVKALEQITGKKATYLRTPTYAYEVDYFTVTREGNLTYSDNADPDLVDTVIAELENRGFHSEGTAYDSPAPETEEDPAAFEDFPPAYETPEAETENAACLAVSIPMESLSLLARANLNAVLKAKGSLIKKALGADDLPVLYGQGEISFPWFVENVTADESHAYAEFISKLCEYARNQKRVNATEKEVENEKYAFRCFLLRLGFIGSEYKTDRKVLLRNLTGSSAFRDGRKEAE